jgi:uncharacterized membrane protein (UPF0127 family)
MKDAGIALLFCATLLTVPAGAADETLDEAFPHSNIVIEASEYACYRFSVHLALQNAQQRRGLMHVRHLDEFAGMLFVYEEAGIHSMWMKNTFIPLDMLFIRGNGVIASVIANTEPQSLQPQSSGEAVNYVLELNAGTAERLRIQSGDHMLWAGDINDERGQSTAAMDAAR